MIVFGFFFVIDLLFFHVQSLKVPEGGWVPLVLGLALTAIMTTWKRGRDLLLARWRAGQPAARPIPGAPAAIPHHPRAWHGGVPHRNA